MARKVTLDYLCIDNFKCFSHLELDGFSEVSNRFVGANGSGKTSLYDSYYWLLTGKDSSGSEGFKIQPIDESGNTIPKLETKVTGRFLVDGSSVTFEKVFKQKWTKPRGTNYEVLNGNECTYFVNSVPVKANEYYEEVANNICTLDNLKMMSSVFSFFELNVQERRKKLMDMAGELPDILTEDRYPNLCRMLKVQKTVDGVKKAAQLAMRELKVKQDAIPSRKSENERNMPQGIDFEALKVRKTEIMARISEIDSSLQLSSDSEKAAYNAKKKLQDEADLILGKLYKMEREAQVKANDDSMENSKKVAEITGELYTVTRQIAIHRATITELESTIERQNKKLNELRDKWKEVNSSTLEFSEQATCPTCGKPYTQEELAETWNKMVESFNAGKTSTLAAISSEGNTYKLLRSKSQEDLETTKKTIAELSEKEVKLNEKLEKAKSVTSKTKEDYLDKNEYDKVQAEYEEAKAKAESVTITYADNSELKEEKRKLTAEYENVLTEIAKENIVARVIARRAELDEEGAKLASEAATQEAILNEVREYTKAHITMVEESISSMFKMVRFQMYEHNLTNDGEREMCECLVNGVPYGTNVNTAARINAGIDIVNAISRHAGVNIPLWIDNKESVTNLLDTESQLFTLEVTENNQLTLTK